MSTAVALFSGGLDSILACRVVAEQGVRVKAVKLVTPFFGYELLAREAAYRAEMLEKYGIEVRLSDVSEPYLAMLRRPAHGYGKNFNPCVDCKILLMRTARAMMNEFGAEFLISGEVLGQRPMSQRLDTLRLIERDSGCVDILLRPLCAKHLPPTLPERQGVIDREKLLDFRGRGRAQQMRLAARYGINEYPAPAGGCMLTDPNLAPRLARFYGEHAVVAANDMCFLLVGRHFRLPGGGLLALGRKEAENERLIEISLPTDWVVQLKEHPGPTAILRGGEPDDLLAAAGLVVRYSKKLPAGQREMAVRASRPGESRELSAAPLADPVFEPWRW